MTSDAFRSRRARLPAGITARAGLLQITAAAILWGTTGVVVAWVHRWTGLNPVAIGSYRLIIAALALLAMTARRWATLVAATRAHPWGVMVAGAGLASYQALYFIGVTGAGVTVATMASLGLAPVVTALWESIAHRSIPRPVELVTVLAAVAGLVLLALGQRHGGAGPHPAAGLIASIGSGLVYGLTTVLARHLSQSVPALTLTALSACFGALALLPVAAIAGLRPGSISGPGPLASMLGLAYIGVVTTAIGYALFNAGLRTTPSPVASVLTLLEALTATVLAVLLLSEPLGLLTAIGAALLLGAVAVLYAAPAPPELITRH